MASVSDSDISDAESIMLERDEGTSLRGKLGVGPPGCCSEDEADAPRPKSAIVLCFCLSDDVPESVTKIYDKDFVFFCYFL